MKRGIIELITGIIFLAGLTFKFAHYPGAALLLVLGLSLGSILLLAQFFKGSSKDPLSSLIYKLSIGNGTMYILGVLFKVMHWPGASFLLVVSMLTMSILLAFSALKTRTWYYALFLSNAINGLIQNNALATTKSAAFWILLCLFSTADLCSFL